MVGQSPPFLESIEKVTGKASYTGNMMIPGMLYAKLLRSPLPHARIVSIDTSRAQALSGVVAVLSRNDFIDADPEQVRFGHMLRDQGVVALDKVRYDGDVVAAVAAEDELTAEEALELIDVEYEELPAVLDVREAIQPGAPLIHDQFFPMLTEMFPLEGTNVCHQAGLMQGDVESAMQEAEYVFEDVYTSPPVQHCALELHACLVVPKDGGLTVWSASQGAFGVKRQLEAMLRMPVHVIVPYVGGGYGSKTQMKIEPVTAALAIKAQRPVKLVLTQEEVFKTFSRPGAVCKLRTGVKSDGTLVARDYEFMVDTGSYATSGPRLAHRTLVAASGPYTIPHVRVKTYAVHTNKTPAGAYRGLPTTQHCLAYETQLDRIAAELGMDPYDIRMKNLEDEDSIHFTGDALHSVGVKECLAKVANAIGWPEGRQTKTPDGKLRGKGLACAMKFVPTSLNPRFIASGSLRVAQDGLLEVLIGSTNMGQGSDTVLAQISAEAMGVSLKECRVIHTDTDLVPWVEGTAASMTVFHVGNALVDAANKLKEELKAVGAELLEIDEESLEVEQGTVREIRNNSKKISFGELVERYGRSFYAEGQYFTGAATRVTEQGEFPVNSTFWSFASSSAEVEVDPGTGEVKVLRMSVAANVGRAIHPKSVEGQLEGSVVMDLGPTLFEEMAYGEGGQLLNAALMEYPLPTMDIAPSFVDTGIVEHPHKDGPFGAKGVGEIGCVVTPASIVNAVYSATGVLMHDLPLTPLRVLEALEKAQQVKA